MFIPVYQPELSGNEKKYVNECLDTNWISAKGRFVKDFEDGIAKYLGVNHAVSVCNGTAAMHLALMTLGIGKGDEVILPSLTYVASANAVTYTGATPVFADSLYESWQIDPKDIERKITEKTPQQAASTATRRIMSACRAGTVTAKCSGGIPSKAEIP